MTIEKKLLNRLNEFELVVEGDRIIGIKATDKEADLAIFTDMLNEYEGTTPLNIIKDFLARVDIFHKFVEMDLISLIRLYGVYDAIASGDVWVVKNAAKYVEAGGQLIDFKNLTGWEIPFIEKYKHFTITYHFLEQLTSFVELRKQYLITLIQKLKDIIERHKHQTQIDPIIPVIIFPKDTLNEIFYPKDINRFFEMEQTFISIGWLKDGKWDKDKNMLVSLILYIEVKMLFKKFGGTKPHSNRLKYRRFFEDRYHVKVEKQMQLKQIEMYNLPSKYSRHFDAIYVVG